MTQDVPPTCPHGTKTLRGTWWDCDDGCVSEPAKNLQVQDESPGAVAEKDGSRPPTVSEPWYQDDPQDDGQAQQQVEVKAPVAGVQPSHVGDDIAVTRTKWLNRVGELIAEGHSDFRPQDLFLAWAFTAGGFNYRTGLGDRHQTRPQIADRANVSMAVVDRFLARILNAGLLAEQDGKAKSLGRQRPTPLYRLTLP